MGTLYVVATPIGNLEDISARALRILAEVSLIAAEDTRHTGKLLSHFKIKTPQTSYFDHNKESKLAQVLKALDAGDVALVSDAGSPGLNDPGYLLVRAAVEAGHQVSPIPGPSAPIAALTTSGLPSDRFLYLGYLPRKSHERRLVIKQVEAMPYTLVWLESPHRLAASLADLHEVLGERQMAVSGELTKMYEEIFRGSISEAAQHFEEHPARGEYTLVVAGKLENQDAWSEQEVREAGIKLIEAGHSISKAAKQIAAEAGWSKSDVYDLLIEHRNSTKTREESQ